MRPILAALCLLATAYAQTYSGQVGVVTLHQAQITMVRNGSFSGWYEIVPGLPVPMTGRVQGGWFVVDGWFATKAKATFQSIVGDGVFLWR